MARTHGTKGQLKVAIHCATCAWGLTGHSYAKYARICLIAPAVFMSAGVAGLLGAAFNSMRMWLWRLRASKTRHILRIGEVRELTPGHAELPDIQDTGSRHTAFQATNMQGSMFALQANYVYCRLLVYLPLAGDWAGPDVLHCQLLLCLGCWQMHPQEP